MLLFNNWHVSLTLQPPSNKVFKEADIVELSSARAQNKKTN